MTSLQKGLLLATAQLALVAGVAAKYAVDRARLPRVWVQTVAYDPDLLIRGRYLSVRLLVSTNLPESPSNSPWAIRDVTLRISDGHLVANLSDHPTGLHVSQSFINHSISAATLMEPVAFFVPEHANVSNARMPGEELWIEVTVPKQGPPRPIRLAVKHGESFTPLDVK